MIPPLVFFSLFCQGNGMICVARTTVGVLVSISGSSISVSFSGWKTDRVLKHSASLCKTLKTTGYHTNGTVHLFKPRDWFQKRMPRRFFEFITLPTAQPSSITSPQWIGLAFPVMSATPCSTLASFLDSFPEIIFSSPISYKLIKSPSL